MSHAQPLLDVGPAGLPVVYTLDAGAYDIVVNGDHLLSWGVEPSRSRTRRCATSRAGPRRRRGPTRSPATAGSSAPTPATAGTPSGSCCRRSSPTWPPSSRRTAGSSSACPERHLLTGGLAAPRRRGVRGALRRLRRRAVGRRRRARSTGASSSSWTVASSSSTGRTTRLMATPGRRSRRRRSLRVEVADGVATITLDRPEALNALTVPMKGELLRGAPAVARDRSVRAVVLTGAGRAFCAGQDLKERLEPDAAPLASSSASATTRSSGRCARSTSRSSARSTAWPPGPVRRSRSPATCGSRPRGAFVLAFGRIGLVPDSAARPGSCRGSSGRPRPRSWPCSATPLSAADAERFGLVAAVVPADEVLATRRARWRRGWRASRRARSPPRSTRSIAPGRSISTGARGGGVPPGGRRRHRRPRRGARGVPREAAAAVHRGVAARLLPPGSRCRSLPLTSVR